MSRREGSMRYAKAPAVVAIALALCAGALLLGGVTRFVDGAPLVLHVPALAWIPQLLLFGGVILVLTAILLAVLALVLRESFARLLGWVALALATLVLGLWLIAAV